MPDFAEQHEKCENVKSTDKPYKLKEAEK